MAGLGLFLRRQKRSGRAFWLTTPTASSAALVVALRAQLGRSIVALLTDPDAGELSLAIVKQRLREQVGKKAVKKHKEVRLQPHAQ